MHHWDYPISHTLTMVWIVIYIYNDFILMHYEIVKQWHNMIWYDITPPNIPQNCILCRYLFLVFLPSSKKKGKDNPTPTGWKNLTSTSGTGHVAQGMQHQKSDLPDEESGGIGEKTPNRRRFKSVVGKLRLCWCFLRREGKICPTHHGLFFFGEVY